ncbi:MAG: hypothetical protein ACLQVK_05240 [Acidimicrobiales bacterium]
MKKVVIAMAVVCVTVASFAPSAGASNVAKSSCMKALSEYSTAIGISAKFDTLATDYEGEILPAYKAGASGNTAAVNAISANLNKWNVQVNALAAQLNALVPKVRTNVLTCEVLLAS